jgi:GGDEF domain-containing protein
MVGGGVIERLKDLRTIGATTPIAVITSGAVTQAKKIELLKAGAWDIFTSPFDPEELSLRVLTWSEAKKEADRAKETSLVDQMTGSYNFDGLSRRVREIVAESRRYERPLACIVLGEPLAAAEADARSNGNDVDRRVVSTLNEVCRVSDAIGRVRDREFIVVAPSTDDAGAETLARRILEALEENLTEVPIRAGVYSVKRSPNEPLDLSDLLGPATAALRKAQAGTDPLFFHSLTEN